MARSYGSTGNTGLILKAAVMDKDRVVEQFVFTQLKIGGHIDKALLKSRYAAKAGEWRTTNLVSSTTGSGKLGWQIKDLPPGFKKVIEMKRNLSGKSTRRSAISRYRTALPRYLFSLNRYPNTRRPLLKVCIMAVEQSISTLAPFRITS